jgi:hypothetical protein
MPQPAPSGPDSCRRERQLALWTRAQDLGSLHTCAWALRRPQAGYLILLRVETLRVGVYTLQGARWAMQDAVLRAAATASSLCRWWAVTAVAWAVTFTVEGRECESSGWVERNNWCGAVVTVLTGR